MYPKEFFSQTPIATELGTCFIVMPFAKQFDQVFRSIKATLEGGLGVTCVRTDELLGGGDIIADILRSLATSEIVIVDVTGKNPNVFYELGIAHMCKPVKKVILISQDIASIPFDLRGFRHIVYESSTAGRSKMAAEIREAVDAVRDRIHRIVLDEHHHGVLAEPLMGRDRCLYGFEVKSALAGHESAKLSLVVTRHVMGDGHNRSRHTAATLRSVRVFIGGMGVILGKPEPIRGTDFSILFERVLDRRPQFRVLHNEVAKTPASNARLGGQPAGEKGRRSGVRKSAANRL